MTTQPDTNPARAAAMMVLAMAIIGAIDNVIAPMSAHIGLWQFHFIRSLIALPLVALMALAGLGALRPRRWGVVTLRSVLVSTAMMFYFGALAFMPIAQALAGLFTSPIFVLLITATLLRGRIGPWRVLAVAAGFTGTVLVLQPDPRAFDVTTLVPVAGGFFYALGAIVTRRYCAGEGAPALLAGNLFALGLAGAVGVLVLAMLPQSGAQDFVTRGWVWPIRPAVPYILLQAVGSVIAVFFIIRAYQTGDPSRVAVFEYAVMIFGPLFAWLLLGQPLGPWQAVGVLLIAIAGAIIAIRSE